MWPRLSTTVIENNVRTSFWFMRNGAFLRLKTLEVGYTLPESLDEEGLYIIRTCLLQRKQPAPP